MFRNLVKFFTPVILGIFFPLSLIASEISEPIRGEIRTHLVNIETKAGPYHFELHFNPSDEVYVKRVLAMLERDTNALADYFDYAPKSSIHIMLSKTNYANGSATVFPWNLINLFKFPPVGGEHLMSIDSWLRGLVLHELVHVIHMDQTRGVLKGLRTVFGSVGKLGGVTPRWFTEGVAVWAESTFTQAGRLKSNLLNYELAQLMRDPKYCHKIDCLDAPGVHPGGQLAYWAGGRFMDYLEREKSGTIRCLIFENSSSLPFFLNTAFKKCTGESAAKKFTKFRATFEMLEGPMPALAGREWAPSYQARMISTSEGTIRYGNTRRTPELTLLTPEGELKFLSRSPGYIETFFNPTQESVSKGEILVSMIAHQSGYAPREIWRYDVNTKKFLGAIDELTSKEVAFDLDQDHYLALSYQRHHWSLELISKHSKEVKLLKTFPALAHVRFAHYVGSRLVYGLTEIDEAGAENFSLRALSLKDGEISGEEMLIENEGLTRILGSCGEKSYIASNGENLELDFSKKNIVAKKLVQAPLLVSGNGQNVSYLVASERAPKHMKCDDFSKTITGATVKLKHYRELRAPSGEPDEKLETRSYPRLSHFIPQYWLIDYISGDNLSALKAYTSLTDPLARHTLDLGVNYYPEISKSVPSASYTYARGYFRLFADYDKSFSQSSITQREDSSEVTSSGVGFDRWWGRYNVSTQLLYANKEASDFISERRIDEFSLGLGLYRLASFYDSFVGDTQFLARVMRSSPENLTNYWGYQYRLNQDLHLFARTKLGLRGTYGRFEKNDFRSGVIYGGGSNSYNSSYFHEFYGVSYSDAFGNRLYTARAQLDITALNIYSAGGGLFPLFLKELHLLGGAELIHADRIFIGGAFVRDDQITSYHAGVRALANLFYFIPIQSDLLYVSTENPFGARKTDMLFLLRGNFSL